MREENTEIKRNRIIGLLRQEVIYVLKRKKKAHIEQADGLALEEDFKEKKFKARQTPSLSTIRRFLGLDKTAPNYRFSEPTLTKFAKYAGHKNFTDFQKNIAQTTGLSSNHSLAKYYAAPFTRLTISLAFRIKEIFEGRNAFLKNHQLKNEFNQYRYISTVYRLAAFLGWLTIIEKENFDFEPVKNYQIRDVIFKCRNCLANGKEVEVLIVEDICALWNIPIKETQQDAVIEAGIKMDHLMLTYIEKYLSTKTSSILSIRDLSADIQFRFLQEVALILEEQLLSKGEQPLCMEVIQESKKQAILEIGRKQYWLFFDWQTSIGDMMRKKINEQTPKYDIIGFGQFEDYFLDQNAPQQRWIKRISPLFTDFEPKVNTKTDARIKQLKDLYKLLLELIAAFLIRENEDYDHQEALIILESAPFIH